MSSKFYFWIAIILLGLGLVFGWLSSLAIVRDLNLSISTTWQSWLPEWFILVSRFISAFEIGVYAIVLPSVFMLIKKGSRREDYFMVLATILTVLPRFLKSIFQIACPAEPSIIRYYDFHNYADYLYRILGENSFLKTGLCFPSSHVFSYTVVFGMTFYLRRYFSGNRFYQQIIEVIAVLLIGSVGVARISLGAHWLTDVLGGYLLGFGVLAALIFLHENSSLWKNLKK